MRQIKTMLLRGPDNGINFFDTAASYGDGASESVGRALAGNTDGIIVSTKVGLRADELANADELFNARRESQRLKLDHVDLFHFTIRSVLPTRVASSQPTEC